MSVYLPESRGTVRAVDTAASEILREETETSPLLLRIGSPSFPPSLPPIVLVVSHADLRNLTASGHAAENANHRGIYYMGLI